MKVAFVHDWLDTYRGGERVLEMLLELYPTAPIFTLFYNPKDLPASITKRDVRVQCGGRFMQPLRKLMLSCLPNMIEQIDFSEFDLVISSSSAVAKGIIVPPHAKHLCYLHSPMRYIWDQRTDYRNSLPRGIGLRHFFDFVAFRTRIWDVTSATRVDQFIVNSHHVKRRVGLYYGKEARVVPPPVAINSLTKLSSTFEAPQRNYFLVAGALVPYKRVDLAIDACEKLGVPLIVAGSGPMEKRLKRRSLKHTKFVHNPSNDELFQLMYHARALLFTGIEDFGILPVEAIALGTPVVAFDRGGIKDYLIPAVNGVVFSHQTLESLIVAIKGVEMISFDRTKMLASVKHLSRENFLSKMREQIATLVNREV